MDYASVALKPGVLFAPTASGGTLMDIGADRFIALSPVSARIWAALVAGADVVEAASAVAEATGRSREATYGLIDRQLTAWRRLALIEPGAGAPTLPVAKPSVPGPTDALKPSRLDHVRTSWSGILRYMWAERRYRHLVRTGGLACALSRLQTERGSAPNDADRALLSTVKAYTVARRAYRQGHSARDCLFRSIGLVATLRRRGIDADLCIGVSDLPFVAHAWVETDMWLLNEALDERCKYVVIGRF